ncbi:MAG TPA: S1 RNA-binding domain-containing protein [Anaeromyxobacteraceae bacterium]|nr:S1 RNA-binding domain-containing protein [Anaeromyxobacteraceae bacterium]
MPNEKKPESPGPIVIRKGQVGPLPETTESESAPPGAAATPARPEPKADNRPLWQRVAEQRTSGGPRPGGGGGPRGPGSRRGGPERGERGPRRERDRGEGRRAPERAEASSPPLPLGEPPPLPDVQAPDEGSFADLFAEAGAAPRQRFKVGDKVAGKIIQLGSDVAFLELGSGVAEGMIEVVELQDDAGNVAARVGDIVDGVVVHASERGVIVSKGRGASKAHRDREALIEAAQTGLPVEGVVKAANKGGLEIEVMGQRAFCPMSQIDVRFVGDPATFVGQKLQFKVQRADQRDVVLSRRALLEEERAERARQTREKLAEGAVFDGAVTSVQDYGAFVDIGGVEGLVHVSELSWDRVSKPQELLKAGDGVRVQVLRIDHDPKKGERISLSVRALVEKPAEPERPAAPPRPAPPPPPRVGDVVKATVDKIEPFGVFVRFAGGRGLVPASETGTPRGADLRKAFKVGDEVTCLVSAIDEQGRFRLSKTEAEVAQERREAAEYMRAQPRAGGKGFGTLGDLLRDKLKR